MSATTESAELRFPIEQIRWSTLDGQLRLALIAALLVDKVGSSMLFIGMLTGRAFHPLSSWVDLFVLAAMIGMGTLAIRNAFQSLPHLFTRAYVITNDGLLIENYQKSVSVPYDDIDKLETIPFGGPATPLKSAVRVFFQRPIGFRLWIDVFPSSSGAFFEALAAHCPRLAPFIPEPEVIDDPSPARFAVHSDRWDKVDFFLPLVIQVPLIVLIGVVPFPTMLWLIAVQLGSDLPHASLWQNLILILIGICGVLQGNAAVLSLLRRVRHTLIRNYVLTAEGLTFEAQNACPCIPWSSIHRIQRSKAVRLFGLSLKPAYRIHWKSPRGQSGAIDLSPLDADGFLEAARERCPRLFEDGESWRPIVDSRLTVPSPVGPI